ncbi:hypothetical protein KJ644_04300 [Candidatus Dependentiae bacterium]|nr:hypothetical protein [Candidatus Dependentiae bacterium]MBU4387660.1 hypothetical protein [Candidatus Dependentiae bacterium]
MNKIFKFIFILVLIFKLNLSAEIGQLDLDQHINLDILTEKDKTIFENLIFYLYERPKEFFLENKKITLGSLLVVSYLLKIVDENRFVLYEKDETKKILVKNKYKDKELKEIPDGAKKELEYSEEEKKQMCKTTSVEEL